MKVVIKQTIILSGKRIFFIIFNTSVLTFVELKSLP